MSAEGFAMIPNWLVRDTTVSAHAKVVFVVLASHTSAAGATFVGHKRIAAEAGISVSSVQRALRELRDRGAVTWRQRRDEAGDLTTSEYRIRVTSGLEDRGSGQADRTVRSQGPDRPVPVTDEVDVPEEDVPEARRARPSMRETLLAEGLTDSEQGAFIADLRRGGVRSPSALVAKLAKDGGLVDRIAEFRDAATSEGTSRLEQNMAVARQLAEEYGMTPARGPRSDARPSRVEQNMTVVRRMALRDGYDLQVFGEPTPAPAWPQLEMAGVER